MTIQNATHCSVTGILTSGCVSRRNTSCRRPLCSTSGSWPNTACAHQKPAYSGGLNQMFSYTLSITNKEKFYVKKIQRDLVTACHIPPLKNQRNKGKCPWSSPVPSNSECRDGLGLKMSNEVLLLNHHIKKVSLWLHSDNGSGNYSSGNRLWDFNLFLSIQMIHSHYRCLCLLSS